MNFRFSVTNGAPSVAITSNIPEGGSAVIQTNAQRINEATNTRINGNLSLAPQGADASFPAGDLQPSARTLETVLSNAQRVSAYLDRMIVPLMSAAPDDLQPEVLARRPRDLAILQCAYAFTHRIIGRTRSQIRARDLSTLTAQPTPPAGDGRQAR